MKEKNIYQPSEVELEILQILWENQPTTVRFVYEKIAENREVSYTTILTFLQRMAKKKMVKRSKKGKTHYYTAVPEEKEVQQNLFRRLLDTAFKGSTMKMVMHALGQDKATPEEIEALQQWLENNKKNETG